VRSQIAELRIAEAKASREISERVLVAAERRVTAGAGSELEQASAELDLAQTRAAEAGAVRERDGRLMELRDALDLRAGVDLTLSSPLRDPEPLPQASTYLEKTVQHHPLLAALRARVTLLDATRGRLESEVSPRIGWYAGVDAAPLSPMYGLLGISVELPIARRNQGPLAQTARARETVETRIDLEQRRLERDVLAAWNSYEGRRRELEQLTAAALPAADRTLSFAEAAWQAGRFDVFRVLAAARDAGRVRALRADALEQAWTAGRALERAAGGPVP
jgi:cobalt-zinc-cadmium efflux system outer membrane protein